MAPVRPRRRRAPKNGAALVPDDLLAKLNLDRSKMSDSVVINSGELDRIRRQTRVVTDSERLSQEKAVESQKAERLEKARVRKERMLKRERELRDRAPELSDAEKDAIRANREAADRARRAKEEEHDDVKRMNQMMLYAKCVTIRDAQLKEKARQAAKAKEDALELDHQMEAERVRALRAYEAREAARLAEQKAGAATIVGQMEARERRRMAEREQKEQEARAMVEELRAREERELEAKRQKAAAGQELLREVMEANNAQALAKQAKKQQEIDEDLRIAEYLRARDRREAEIEAEAAAARAEKDRVAARLLAQQQRAADKRGEVDELRAKRYQETKDREWRARERAAAEKRAARADELREAREQQRRDKERKLVEAAMHDHEEFMAMQKHQEAARQQDIARREAAKQSKVTMRDELLEQITLREEIQRAERERLNEESRRASAPDNAERVRLEQIKREKLQQLEREGVPEKYRVEIARQKLLHFKLH